MFQKVVTSLVIVLIPVLCSAQTTREKNALKDLHKNRWNKAYQSLVKSIRKDSTNVAAFYILSQYYFHPENPSFSIAEAYRHIEVARFGWAAETDSRQRSRWAKLPMDSSAIVELRKSIETKAFEEAKERNREETYITYLNDFPFASQRDSATILRDEVAYRSAVVENNHHAFLEFIHKYPDARQLPQAKAKYEELLYLDFTRDQRIESYQSFLRDYPATPYRAQAEENIFKILTASGDPETFRRFLAEYPNSSLAKRAAALLFHILKEERMLKEFPVRHMNDSLIHIINSGQDYLIPFLTKGKFGFMDGEGHEIVPAVHDQIDEGYLCGNINEDVVVLADKIVSTNGSVVWTGSGVTELDDIGYGFIIIDRGDSRTLLHKTGFQPVDGPVEDAKILGGRLLAIKNNGDWGVFSLTGRPLVSTRFDKITPLTSDVLILHKGTQQFLSSASRLSAQSQTGLSPYAGVFDEVRKVGNLIWATQDSLKGIYNDALELIVPPARRHLKPAFFGAIDHTADSAVTFNEFGEASEIFSALEARAPWVAAKTREGWVIFDPLLRIYKSAPYDTLQLFGPFAVGRRSSTIEVHTAKVTGPPLTLALPDAIHLIPGQDSLAYLMINQGKKNDIYDTQARHLFSSTYDRVSYAGGGYFIVERRDKKGLVDAKGKVIVPVEYDAIGTASKGMISLLKAMKFGLFDVEKQNLIKPSSDKNIGRFNKDLYTVFRNGGWGFVSRDGKAVSEFVFQEINNWNDSVALVRRDGALHLYNPTTRETIISGIRTMRPVLDTPEEKVFIVFLKDQVGVVSNRKGIVIPINFSDIVNVGSPERPTYFTEKHVKEASLYVVIYYNEKGKMLRREVYEQDEYERIYCNE